MNVYTSEYSYARISLFAITLRRRGYRAYTETDEGGRTLLITDWVARGQDFAYVGSR